MRSYLYFIKFYVKDQEFTFEDHIHAWFGTQPTDKEIREYILQAITSTEFELVDFSYLELYNPSMSVSNFSTLPSVPFVDEVEEFNKVMGKEWQNRITPTINSQDADFVVKFIQEELDELKESVNQKDIVGILDAILDITYVGLGNGALTFGLKDKIKKGYAEVQASNLSKICNTEEEANLTVVQRFKEQGRPCHWEKIGEKYVVYRDDMKVMKSINYFKPNLRGLFTDEDIFLTSL
jgi:predicted HAD superfamily Cof-like phosphohydrolase